MKQKALTMILAAAGAIGAYAPAALAHGSEDHAANEGQAESWGAYAQLGNGYMRTYVILSKEKDPARGRKKPMEIGVEIPAAVMNSLPAEDKALVADLPIQARDTPFQYMMIDWNSKGHEPAGVYDLPHFDFHFYIQDLDEVMAIEPGTCSGLRCDAFEKAMKPVPTELTPAGYINVGSVVPYMGNHLIDPTSPEFNGQKFTSTWLYGAYDGAITFYEPMITRETLVNNPNQCTTLKLPQAYAESGFYPTAFCTKFDQEKQTYRIFLKDFDWRAGQK